MTYLKATFVLGIIIELFSYQVYSQEYTSKNTFLEDNTDSLERSLSNKSVGDTARLINLIKLEKTYLWQASAKNFSHIDEIERISKKLNHSAMIAYWKFMKAMLLNAESKNDEAERYLSEALNYFLISKDISAEINIYSYLSIVYLYRSPNKKLATYYLEKARTLLIKSDDVHDKMVFLMAYLNNEQTAVNQNNVRMYSIMSQIIQLYNKNKSLSYAKFWVKLLESEIYKYSQNYVKENEILKTLAKQPDSDNFYLLARMQLSLADSYVSLNLFDNAIAEYKKGIMYFYKVPHLKVQPLVDKTNYQILINILEHY